MDDKNLQSEFDGYFKGANLPENITADAKAQVKPRKRDIRKWFLRLAPVAAAIVLIVALSVVFINRFESSIAPGSDGNFSESNGDRYTYYSSAELSQPVLMDPYSAKGVKGLKFAEELYDSPNSTINLTAFYQGENLVLTKAEMSFLHNGYRHDAVLYVEFTEEYYCFDELKDYFEGNERYYLGYDCILTEKYDEGENVYMLYTQASGVKYYLSVMTSEPEGYRAYFNFFEK